MNYLYEPRFVKRTFLFIQFSFTGSAWREKQLQYQMPDHDDEQLFNNQSNHHHQKQQQQQYSAEFKFLRHKRRKASIRTELCQLQQQQQSQPCYKV